MEDFLSTPVGQWTGISIAVLTGGFAQAMMKFGTQRVGEFGESPALEYLLRLLTNPFVLLAILAYGVGVIAYMFMLSRLDLSYLYPLMVALGLILSTIVAALVFHERISLLRLGGIAVVIAGIFLLARS
jgi:multidrug transporter EmrE-like cation transporter